MDEQEILQIEIAKVEVQLMEKLNQREQQRSHRGGRRGTTERPRIQAPAKTVLEPGKAKEEDVEAKQDKNEKPRREVLFIARAPEAQKSRSKSEATKKSKPMVQEKAPESPKRRLHSEDRRPRSVARRVKREERSENKERGQGAEMAKTIALREKNRRPRSENRRPRGKDHRPKGGNNLQKSENSRPRGEDNRPNGEDRHPVHENRSKSRENSRLKNEVRRLRDENRRLLSEERRRRSEGQPKETQMNPHWRKTSEGNSECRCLKCYQWGHHRKDCPNPRTYSAKQQRKRAATAEGSRGPQGMPVCSPKDK